VPNSVIVGHLRAIRTEAIVLGGDVRILLPPPLSVTELP
jgi:hypothetical protein